MIFIMDLPDILTGLETEIVVLMLFVFFSSQWNFISAFRNLYTRTNKFETFYEMHNHYLENKKIYQLNDIALKDLKCSVDRINEKLINMENDLKNQAYPAKVYELISMIYDKLDEKNIK